MTCPLQLLMIRMRRQERNVINLGLTYIIRPHNLSLKYKDLSKSTIIFICWKKLQNYLIGFQEYIRCGLFYL